MIFFSRRPGQLAAAAIRLHPVPEMQMVVVLAGIVEHGRILAERTLDDLLEGLALEFGPLDRVVAVGHVGLVMLVVVDIPASPSTCGAQGRHGHREDWAA